MASSTRLEAHHSISNYHGWRTSTFSSSFLLFVSRSSPQGSYSTRPCLKNGRSLFFPRLALIFHLNVCICVRSCERHAKSRSSLPAGWPYRPNPLPSTQPPFRIIIIMTMITIVVVHGVKNKKEKQKSFFCSLTRLKRRKRMGEIQQKCAIPRRPAASRGRRRFRTRPPP